VKALVYPRPTSWKTALGDTTGVADGGNPLWWRTGRREAAPFVPGGGDWGGQSWTFWQFTNKARVPGFAHPSTAIASATLDPTAAALPPYPGGAPAPSLPPTIVRAAQTGKTLAACRARGAAGSAWLRVPVAALRRRRSGLPAKRSQARLPRPMSR
jgi:hypothetical protein